MATQERAVDLSVVKARQREMWAAGNFVRIGNSLVIMGELLCEAADLRAGQKVLDVATGSGNTALSAARRGCEVVGLDYVSQWVEHARERAEAEQMEASFEVGDAEALPYPDGSFDALLSTVGVMFAPDQEKAASELLRVCKPGGKIGLANWTPNGYIGSFFRAINKHLPPLPGIKSPLSWGIEERLQELFGEGVSPLAARRRSYVFRYLSPEHYLDHFRANFGPLRAAFDGLAANGRDSLARDLLELLRQRNVADDGTLVLPAEYLEFVAVRSTR